MVKNVKNVVKNVRFGIDNFGIWRYRELITLYTAVGKYSLKKNNDGMLYPSVTVNLQEKALGIDEMILWSTLLWNIMTVDELKDAYSKKAMDLDRDPERFEEVLRRLTLRDLVVSASAVKGDEALYKLLSDLYIVPIKSRVRAKIWTFLNLIFKEHVPFSLAKKVLHKEVYTEMENKVLHLTMQSLLSSAEVVKCIGTKVTDVSSREKVLEALYDDDVSTCDNLGQMIWLFDEHKSVMEAISTLYLNRSLVFDKLT